MRKTQMLKRTESKPLDLTQLIEVQDEKIEQNNVHVKKLEELIVQIKSFKTRLNALEYAFNEEIQDMQEEEDSDEKDFFEDF